MGSGIVSIKDPVNFIEEFSAITVIGDPGCDGLGAGTMSIFARALTSAASSNFTVIAGDIVHRGIKPLYANVSDFVNAVAVNPVYMLCGNHDTAHYDEYFGRKEYVLCNEKTLLIFLDDSKRHFSPESIDFLKEMLQNYIRENIVLFFHIPPPNTIGTNTVSREEWNKVLEVIEPYRQQIQYIICGHVHSYYEDYIDGGYRLIVSGGGGARIEYVSDKVDPAKAHHHVVKLFFNQDGKLAHQHIALQSVGYTKELEDETLKSFLENALHNEAVAHVKYALFAEEAEEKGLPGIAKMFRAFSDSEFYHARNHFYVLNRMNSVLHNLHDAEQSEDYEIHVMYDEYLNYAKTKQHGLSRYSFYDSLEAEKIHDKLIRQALHSYETNRDIELTDYHTCTSCGYTFSGSSEIVHCPICGAPADKIKRVT